MSIVAIGLVVAMILFRRWRHLVTYLASSWVLQIIGVWLIGIYARPRPYDITQIGRWEGYSLPSATAAIVSFTAVAVIYALVVPGRSRTIAKFVGVAVVALVVFARLYLGVDHPFDDLTAVAIGVVIPLLAFRFFTPNEFFPVAYRRGKTAHLDVTGPRGAAIRQAVQDQLGLTVVDSKPVGLAGSGGSTPLRLQIAGDPDTYLFGKLYAMNHVRADRWYKLGRTILYGNLEDERSFKSVRQLIQHEDYAMRLFGDAGLPTARSVGIVELTPDREYLLVTEFFDGADGDRRRRGRRPDHRRRAGPPASALERRDRPSRHQARQPPRQGRPPLSHRRRLRPGPPVPVAGGGRPRQHDARARRPHRPRTRLSASPHLLHPGRDRRGFRRRPGYRQPDAAADNAQEGRPQPRRPVPSARTSASTDLSATLGRAPHRPRARPARRPFPVRPERVRHVHPGGTAAQRPAAARTESGRADVRHQQRDDADGPVGAHGTVDPVHLLVPCRLGGRPGDRRTGTQPLRAAGVRSARRSHVEAQACEIGTAVEVPSEELGARRFEAPTELPPDVRATRTYLFEGGASRSTSTSRTRPARRSSSSSTARSRSSRATSSSTSSSVEPGSVSAESKHHRVWARRDDVAAPASAVDHPSPRDRWSMMGVLRYPGLAVLAVVTTILSLRLLGGRRGWVTGLVAAVIGWGAAVLVALGDQRLGVGRGRPGRPPRGDRHPGDDGRGGHPRPPRPARDVGLR